MRSFFLLLVLLGCGLLAQAGQPIASHYEQHLHYYSPAATAETDYDAILGFPSYVKKRRTNKHFMRRTVYGFHPGWCGTTWKSYDFGLLPVVAYYGYVVDPATGSARTSYFWKTSPMIDEAHAKGSSVDLVVAIGTEKDNRRLLGNAQAVANLVDSLDHYLTLRDGDGICLDFENLGGPQANAFTSFVRLLHGKLAQNHPSATITLCLPPDNNEQAFAIDSLRAWVDYYVVKPYAHEGYGSPVPIAPLTSQDPNIPSTDASISNWLRAGVSKEQLLLGTPNYSLKWSLHISASNKPRWPELVPYADLKRNYNYPHRTDSVAGMERYEWSENSIFYELYASDENSMRLRYELANDRNLGGVAIWALGYDHGFDALWGQLKKSFSQSVREEVNGLAIEERDQLLIGPDNGETRERNRNNWIPMLVGCVFFIVLLWVLRKVMKAGPGM